MPVTVGTNSYLTLADFKSLADMFGDSYPDDEKVNAALVSSAIKFIDANYKFKGDKLDNLQAMKLPTNLVAIDDIKYGAYQAALQQSNGALFIDPTQNSAGQVTKQRDKLDVLETETEYAEFSAASYTHDTTQIDNLLAPYASSGTGGNMGKLRKC